jgi:hypothetical protein
MGLSLNPVALPRFGRVPPRSRQTGMTLSGLSRVGDLLAEGRPS